MKKIPNRYQNQDQCSSCCPFRTMPRYPLRPYSVRLLQLPGGCLNPSESGRKGAIYCIRPADFSTKKNYPPHKNHADARFVAAFDQSPADWFSFHPVRDTILCSCMNNYFFECLTSILEKLSYRRYHTLVYKKSQSSPPSLMALIASSPGSEYM